jgi:hypothetical protein
LIKALTKAIRETITWGVTALPFKRNLIPRFTKGGAAQETMKDTLIEEKRRYQDSWMEDFSVTHATFPFMCGRHRTLFNHVVLHDSACVALHYSIFLVQLDQMLRMEKDFLKF